ncbi:MAG: hypothetical protein ACRDJG_01230 [Actinomycetota bacterium]
MRSILIAGMLASCLMAPALVEAAEKECDRWLKLVDGEVRERREALEKKSGVEKARLQEVLTRANAQLSDARAACKAGNDKGATLAALDLWDAFVEDERRARALSLNSRLNVLALRIDRLKVFSQRGWKARMSGDAELRFLAELDRFDGVLAEALKQALR